MSEGRRYGCQRCNWTGYIAWRDRYGRNMATQCQCLRNLVVAREKDEISRSQSKKRWRKKQDAVPAGEISEVAEWKP